MKALLILSLTLNAMLLAAAGYFWKQAMAKADAPASKMIHVTNTVPQNVEKSAVPVPVVKTNRLFDWRRVESEDYRQYITNLRAVGCPEKTIRDIIVADVNELFRARAREQSPATNRFEYWKSGSPFAGLLTEQTISKQQELSKEKREMLKALLGDSAPAGLELSSMVDTSQQMLSRMLDFLPADKMTPLMEIEQKYNAKMMDAQKAARQGDMTAMRQAMKDKDAEMLQLLSPEQKLEYDLRLSQTAMMMRMQMGDFQPSEQEFREMYKLQKAVEDKYMMADMGGEQAKQEAKAARQQLDQDMEALLGPDQYRLYTYEQRWPSDPLNTVAKDYNVPKDTAFKVFDLQKEAQKEADRVKADQSLTPEARTAALAAVRAETEKTIGQVLGPDATPVYVKKAKWLKKISN